MPHPHQPDGCAVSGLLCRLFFGGAYIRMRADRGFLFSLVQVISFYFLHFISLFHCGCFIQVFRTGCAAAGFFCKG